MQKSTYEFISRHTADPIVQWKTCRRTGKPFAIFQSDIDFLNKISPTFDGKKYKIPLPTLCPEERNKRRILFRNDSKIYRRNCDKTGKSFISMYSPDKPYIVYHQDIRYSDQRDALDYGQEIDFSQSFFKQFQSLYEQVPKLGMQLQNAENSEYCCVASGSKDCYLSNVCSWSENVHHCSRTVYSSNSVDCLRCFKIENSYNAVLCTNSYYLIYCVLCDNSSNCMFSYQLNGCQNCCFCRNLTNKQYCYGNKQLTKEEYQKKIKSLYNDNTLDTKQTQNLFQKIMQQVVYHQNNNKNSTNATGSFVVDSHDIKLSFDIMTGENCSYYFDAGGDEKDCMDCSYGGSVQRAFESLSAVGHNIGFTMFCWGSTNVWYSDMCMDCQDCFGCCGLRNKSYCIFNKQYTKEEYNRLLPKIIGHMMETGERGEFFDPSLSPFGYNETVAQEYFPLTREEAVSPLLQGEGSGVRSNRPSYKRMDKEYPVNVPEGTPTIDGRDDHLRRPIAEISDDILTKAIICEVSGRPFRLVKPELEFYRKHGLPIPRKHPDVRHAERLAKRPGRELHLRHCDKCGVEMLSVYKPSPNPSLLKEGKGKVYCEECYQTEIYG